MHQVCVYILPVPNTTGNGHLHCTLTMGMALEGGEGGKVDAKGGGEG